MTMFSAPGIYVTESLIGPSYSAPGASPSVGAFMGEHWRGPIDTPIYCANWSAFVNAFGGFNPKSTPVLANPYLAYAVYYFFQGGGQGCWVSRTGCSATPGATATAVLVDSSATPQSTLELTAGILGQAGSPGTWGNALYYSISAQGGAGSGLFNLVIYYGGTSAANQVESWSGLSMAPTSPRYAPAILNSPTSGSVWVVATDLGDSAAFPTNTPAVATGVAFTGGVDPGDPAVSDRTNALTYGSAPFDTVAGILNMNLPGESNVTVLGAAIGYAQARPYSFLVIDPPAGLTPAGVVSFFQSLSPVSSKAALYYPWGNAQNPASGSMNSQILLPPGAFVLGQMVATDTSQGVWVAPAGVNKRLSWSSAQVNLSNPAIGTLTTNNVNALRTRADGNVVVWGARTMEAGYASLYVPVRRTLNYIEYTLATATEYAVFAPNDASLWSQLAATATQFLEGLYALGAFPGTSPSSSFFVTCDDTINTPQTVSQGVVKLVVGVALMYPAEFVSLTISQYQPSGISTVTPSA